MATSNPANLPLESAVRMTNARLGPGDAAPAKRVSIKSSQASVVIAASTWTVLLDGNDITATAVIGL